MLVGALVLANSLTSLCELEMLLEANLYNVRNKNGQLDEYIDRRH